MTSDFKDDVAPTVQRTRTGAIDYRFYDRRARRIRSDDAHIGLRALWRWARCGVEATRRRFGSQVPKPGTAAAIGVPAE